MTAEKRTENPELVHVKSWIEEAQLGGPKRCASFEVTDGGKLSQTPPASTLEMKQLLGEIKIPMLCLLWRKVDYDDLIFIVSLFSEQVIPGEKMHTFIQPEEPVRE